MTGETLNNRGGIHEDIIGEEDMSQEEKMALALKYCHDTSLETLVIPVMVMSSMQTNEDIDGKGEAGGMQWMMLEERRMRSWEEMVMVMVMVMVMW